MLTNYFKTALRNILKYKVFSFINVFGLASSMSVSMLIILMLSDQKNYDQFHSKKDRIYRILTSKPKAKMGLMSATTSAPLGQTLKSEYALIEESTRLELGVGGDATYQKTTIELRGFFAEPSFFKVFDYPLHLGDPKTALSAPNSIVISREIAKELFHNENPIGQSIDFSDRGLNLLKGIDIERPSVSWGQFIVTGVLDNSAVKSHLNFDALVSASSLLSLIKSNLIKDYSLDWLDHNTGYTYVVIVPGKAKADLSAAINDLVERKYANVEESKGLRLVAQRLTEITPGPFVSSPPNFSLPLEAYYFLFVLAGMIMLLSCLNYTNLSTARALSRAKEVGVRKVTGANRRSLIGQFLSESILTAFIALAVAFGLLFFLRTSFNGLWINQYLQFDLTANVWVYLVFAGFAVVVGLTAGIYPAFVLSRFKPVTTLRTQENQKVGKLTLQRVLSTIQFVVSLFFIITSLTVYNQFKYHTNLDYGFSPDLIVNVSLQSADYTMAVNALRAVPGVSAVSAVDQIPGSGQGTHGISLKRAGTDEPEKEAVQLRVNPEFLDNLGIPLIAGVNLPFEFSDHLVVVNESAAKALGFEPPSSIVGQLFQSNIDRHDLKVVGVVRDFRFRMPSEQDGIAPLILRNQDRFRFLQLKVVSTDMYGTIEKLKKEWLKLDPIHPFKYQFYSEQLRSTNKAFQDVVSIISFTAFISISIACLGLLGITTYHAEKRKKEVGIRKVLGAEVLDISLLLSKSFLMLLTVAVCIGGPIAYFGNNAWLQNFPNRVAFGIGTVLMGTIFLLFLGLVTIGWQVWIAASNNPAKVLRSE
jgi:putative ABC transport system permease protein